MEYQPYKYLGRFFNMIIYTHTELLMNFSAGTHTAVSEGPKKN